MDVLETLDNLQNAAEQDSEKNKSNNKKSEYLYQQSEIFLKLGKLDFINLYHLFSITQHQLGFSYMILFTRIGTKPKTLKYFI